MGRDTELFRAAQTGNIMYLERAFASCLGGGKGGGGGGGGGRKQQHIHGFGSGIGSLRKSANPNIQDDSGYTLLHHATLNGQRETVSLLLRCGASTTIPDCSGSCPLHLAAWKGDLEIVKCLVMQGPSRANVNHQSDTDDTALHLAAQYGYSNVVEFLLERHADPIIPNCKGETPLDLAALYGHLDTVHLLISHCPELLSISRAKFSPLHLAARNGHTLVVLSLINAGISVNVMGEHGTPLHEAALFGKGDTVKLLLDKGASIDARDREGKSVLDLLREFPAEKAKEIRRMIEEHKEDVTQTAVSSSVIAVAKNSCNPLSASSTALPFSAGDHIVVLRRTAGDVFVGSANGKTGSFLAQDVTFCKGVVGVELLGHRRRLLYGVAELCSTHPSWALEGPSRQAQVPTSPPALQVSLYKDYRSIQGTKQQAPLPPSPLSPTLNVRPPSEAQANIVDLTNRSCHLPSTSWHHPNSALISETVSYQAKYLGSVIVVRVHGTQSTEEACLRLRMSTEHMQKLPSIILSISWKGVKFVDDETKMVVSTHAIQDISYCSQDIEDKRVFAYITKDKSGMFYCHVFMAASKKISDEVVMTIGQAFEIAYQKVMRARTKSTLQK